MRETILKLSFVALLACPGCTGQGATLAPPPGGSTISAPCDRLDWAVAGNCKRGITDLQQKEVCAVGNSGPTSSEHVARPLARDDAMGKLATEARGNAVLRYDSKSNTVVTVGAANASTQGTGQVQVGPIATPQAGGNANATVAQQSEDALKQIGIELKGCFTASLEGVHEEESCFDGRRAFTLQRARIVGAPVPCPSE